MKRGIKEKTIYLQVGIHHCMGPIYLGQFRLLCHGTCRGVELLQDFQQSP